MLRHPWRALALLVAALACLAVVILWILASHYQPVSFGSDSGLSFPGLPAGKGLRLVNNLVGFHEDIYIPPQRGMFGLFASITNNGTHPVTIVSASAPSGSGFSPAGQVRYSTPGMGGSIEIPPPTSRVLHDVVLQPGHEMFLGFPVKMWPCTTFDGWQGFPSFTVTTRYLVFTHTVELPWGMSGDSLIMHLPEGRPGKGVLCAPGTTRANLPKLPPQNPGPQPVAGATIRIYKYHNTGVLRLTQMTASDAAALLGIPLKPCFLQTPVDPWRPPTYQVVNFDLNYTGLNNGATTTGPNVRLTIAGPDGTPMIAAVPQGPAYDTITCQPVQSFLLSSGGHDSQEVIGLTLRVPLHMRLDHLLILASGRTITVPLVPGAPHSVSLRL